MKKGLFIILVCLVSLLLSSCSVRKNIKSEKYKAFYSQKPLVILIMPPINHSFDVDAKEYFHSTLNVPIVDAGYYVLPPFLTMEILKKESAYDSELFADKPLDKFREVFGADLVLFTYIHKWDKSQLNATINIDVEYVFKSATNNEIVYSRRGAVTYDTSVSTGFGGLLDLTLSVVNTAVAQNINVARKCNIYTFGDLPAGSYSPKHGIDGLDEVGDPYFQVILK